MGPPSTSYVVKVDLPLEFRFVAHGGPAQKIKEIVTPGTDLNSAFLARVFAKSRALLKRAPRTGGGIGGQIYHIDRVVFESLPIVLNNTAPDGGPLPSEGGDEEPPATPSPTESEETAAPKTRRLKKNRRPAGDSIEDDKPNNTEDDDEDHADANKTFPHVRGSVWKASATVKPDPKSATVDGRILENGTRVTNALGFRPSAKPGERGPPIIRKIPDFDGPIKLRVATEEWRTTKQDCAETKFPAKSDLPADRTGLRTVIEFRYSDVGSILTKNPATKKKVYDFQLKAMNEVIAGLSTTVESVVAYWPEICVGHFGADQLLNSFSEISPPSSSSLELDISENAGVATSEGGDGDDDTTVSKKDATPKRPDGQLPMRFEKMVVPVEFRMAANVNCAQVPGFAKKLMKGTIDAAVFLKRLSQRVAAYLLKSPRMHAVEKVRFVSAVPEVAGACLGDLGPNSLKDMKKRHDGKSKQEKPHKFASPGIGGGWVHLHKNETNDSDASALLMSGGHMVSTTSEGLGESSGRSQAPVWAPRPQPDCMLNKTVDCVLGSLADIQTSPPCSFLNVHGLEEHSHCISADGLYKRASTKHNGRFLYLSSDQEYALWFQDGWFLSQRKLIGSTDNSCAYNTQPSPLSNGPPLAGNWRVSVAGGEPPPKAADIHPSVEICYGSVLYCATRATTEKNKLPPQEDPCDRDFVEDGSAPPMPKVPRKRQFGDMAGCYALKTCFTTTTTATPLVRSVIPVCVCPKGTAAKVPVCKGPGGVEHCTNCHRIYHLDQTGALPVCRLKICPCFVHVPPCLRVRGEVNGAVRLRRLDVRGGDCPAHGTPMCKKIRRGVALAPKPINGTGAVQALSELPRPRGVGKKGDPCPFGQIPGEYSLTFVKRVCRCTHGLGAQLAKCPRSKAWTLPRKCAACDPGFLLTMAKDGVHSTCELIVCSCLNGKPTVGVACGPTPGVPKCDPKGCDPGHYFKDNFCPLKKCKCGPFLGGSAGAVAAQGLACPKHNMHFCVDCPKQGYTLSDVNGTNPGQCDMNRCLCQNGQNATLSNCPKMGQKMCTKCDRGYERSGPNCVEKRCICPHGKPVDKFKCVKGKVIQCDPKKCDRGYHPEQIKATNSSGGVPVAGRKLCVMNRCTCSGGVRAKGAFCQKNGEENCVACDKGYHKVEKQCHQNICECNNGVSATGERCIKNGAEICVSCDPGYWKTEGHLCMLRKCYCGDGVGAVGLDCPRNDMEYCMSCDAGRWRHGVFKSVSTKGMSRDEIADLVLFEVQFKEARTWEEIKGDGITMIMGGGGRLVLCQEEGPIFFLAEERKRLF